MTVRKSNKNQKKKNLAPQKKLKNILLISYHFPPSTAVGGLRIANFAKNLPKFGINSYVLTIKDHYLKDLDIERLSDIETEKIFKTIKLPSIRSMYLRLKAIYYSLLSAKRISIDDLENSWIRNSSASGTTSKLRQLKHNLAVLLMTVPDTERNWILPAILKGLYIIKRRRIDCILTSSPPPSIHLIGIWLRAFADVRWVADFRDPWFIGKSRRRLNNTPMAIKIDSWLEKSVIRRADLVLTNTDRLRNALAASYNKQSQDKFFHIANGFDAEFYSKFKHLKKYEKFTLTYAGTLYIDRTPEPLFKALKELTLEDKVNPQDINVKLVGNCQYINGYPTTELINDYDLGSVVEVVQPVLHSKSLEIIKKSHLALVFAPDQPLQIPAKVYDYMSLGTRILALTGEGATSDCIRETDAGVVFCPSDIKGIKRFILQTMNANKFLNYGTNSEKIYKLNINVIMQDLVNILKRIS